MDFFKRVLNQIFNEKEQKKSLIEHPITKTLKRSDEFIAEYQKWKKGNFFSLMKGDLQSAYYKKKKNIDSSKVRTIILDTPYAEGFAFFYQEHFPKKSFYFLLEYFKDAILQLGYRLQNSQHILRDLGRYVETTERYYLKPPLNAELPFDQLYGNITIELTLKDEKIYLIKLSANKYSSREYTEALPFNQLFDLLFTFDS